jgi:hypothetical protein
MKNSSVPKDENAEIKFEESVEEFIAARIYVFVNGESHPYNDSSEMLTAW